MRILLSLVAFVTISVFTLRVLGRVGEVVTWIIEE
jgi:hypothetical protein